METTICCEKMMAELDAWKEKANHIARELDNMQSGDKQNVLPEIIELHMFIEEIYERIDVLKRNCPEAWESPEIGVLEVRDHTLGNWGKDWEDAFLGKTAG